MKIKYMISATCCSHVGRVRKKNEDNLCFNNSVKEEDDKMLSYQRFVENGLYFAVFDGMGGENFGELASERAASEMLKLDSDLPRVNTLKTIVNKLNDAVILKQQEMLTDKMGTTMASLHFYQNDIWACNVGDSRIYRVRNNIIQQLTIDDNERCIGIRTNKGALIQYLGMDPNEVILEPHILKRKFESGDIYLLCSDGLTDMLTDFEIKNIINNYSSAEERVESLVSAALECGGKDNITVIICEIYCEGK